MHCSRCSVEVALDVTYKGKKEEEQAGMMRGIGDAEEDSLPVNVTSADLTVATVRSGTAVCWVLGLLGGGGCPHVVVVVAVAACPA